MVRSVRSFGRVILQNVPFGKVLKNYLKWHLFCVYKTRLIPKKSGIFYNLNTETGLIDTKERSSDGIFEYPGMIVTNQTIGNLFLTKDIHRVVNIGSGVATFENQNAQSHPAIQFVACEMDQSSTEWARSNRSFANVKYTSASMRDIIKNEGKFDLALTIDVIEHVADYKSFLDEFSQLADKAVISTPNRDMDIALARGPLYKHHVQEFNAGELFFILKMYYRKVELFSAPNPMKSELVPVGFYSTYEKLYAYCEK